MTNTCIDFFLRKTEESPTALTHLSRTFQLLNKRLGSKDAVTDMTIGLTAVLSIRESMRGDLKTNMIHLDGLQQMVELRGGLNSFEDEVSVLQKICSTTMIAGTEERYRHVLCVFPEGASSNMHQLVIDTLNVNTLFNGDPDSSKPNAFEFQAIIPSLLRRLLCIDETEFERFTQVQLVWFFGLVTFVGSFMFQFGRRSSPAGCKHASSS
ncbi:hypothetical protein QQZ08_000993 [Neonectria magnoliae]|uniref:Uncharacterized protein n=1 Tax=Neonectria magnoliae TaxID=2732573 RepID=A0ABR1IGV1_9HYPO